jgi:hypothetical protein
MIQPPVNVPQFDPEAAEAMIWAWHDQTSTPFPVERSTVRHLECDLGLNGQKLVRQGKLVILKDGALTRMAMGLS